MNGGRTAFVNWATKCCQRLATVEPAAPFADLAPIADMIGDARIVALSEGMHGAAEPLEFRNRLLQFLVLERGFSAIAIESGIAESRIVHDYVLGGPGEITDVVARGFSWTFDRLPQNQWLVQWLADHNANAGSARKVNFYGFDVPGSPGEPRASRQLDCALVDVLQFLADVDEANGRIFHDRLETSLRVLRRGFALDSTGDEGYEMLSRSDRDALTATVSDLITLMERNQLAYAEASSSEHFAWAYRAAVGARQLDAWLRELPLGWTPPSSGEFDAQTRRFLSTSTDIRDRAQADNLEWILEQEGPTGRTLVFASRFHLSAAPVWAPWSSPTVSAQTVAGVYLRRRHGKRLVTVGNLIRCGDYSDGDRKRSLGPMAAESLDCIAADVGEPLFVLDLRAAPGEVAKWLRQEHLLGSEEYPLRLSPADAFDVILYIDTVTPA